MKTLLKKIFK